MAGLGRTLCHVDSIPDGGSLGFGPAPGSFTGLFAVRRGNVLAVYVNACPHLGVSLDWAPHRFLTEDGTRIICSTHGAEFCLTEGLCLRGPCEGDRLRAVPFVIESGMLTVDVDAGI